MCIFINSFFSIVMFEISYNELFEENILIVLVILKFWSVIYESIISLILNENILVVPFGTTFILVEYSITMGLLYLSVFNVYMLYFI